MRSCRKNVRIKTRIDFAAIGDPVVIDIRKNAAGNVARVLHAIGIAICRDCANHERLGRPQGDWAGIVHEVLNVALAG